MKNPIQAAQLRRHARNVAYSLRAPCAFRQNHPAKTIKAAPLPPVRNNFPKKISNCWSVGFIADSSQLPLARPQKSSALPAPQSPLQHHPQRLHLWLPAKSSHWSTPCPKLQHHRQRQSRIDIPSSQNKSCRRPPSLPIAKLLVVVETLNGIFIASSIAKTFTAPDPIPSNPDRAPPDNITQILPKYSAR